MTKDIILVYKRIATLEIVGYSDLDFNGCPDDLKSTSGYIFTLVDGGHIMK